MDDGSSLDRLIVLEQEGIFVVVSEDDPSDWIASFTQDARFPARDWAERMADLYNIRSSEHDTADLENVPLFTGSHHPVRHSHAEESGAGNPPVHPFMHGDSSLRSE